MDTQSLEEDALHQGHFMKKVLYTEAQTHPSHSDSQACWPAQPPEFFLWGGDALDRNTNCLLYGENHQPSQRVCVENPPSLPCSCQQNAGNASQPDGSTRQDSPQSRSRGEQADLGGSAPLPGAGPASNAPVCGSGQHPCPQPELTFSLASTAGEGSSAQQQPWPTMSPAPFTPLPSQPFTFNAAQGAVVPRAWRGPLCAHVQSHTSCTMHAQCCWRNWQALAYTPGLYRVYPPPVGCCPPHCPAMPAAWQPQRECGAALRTCPYLETLAGPGQSRPTARQMGPAGVSRGSEQSAAEDLGSPGYPTWETPAKICFNETDRVHFNENNTLASREWNKDDTKGNGQSCSYQSPTPPCSSTVRWSEGQTDTAAADGSSTRNVEAASSSKSSSSNPSSKQGNPELQLMGASTSPQTGLSGELASCCPCCGQANVSGQRYCPPCPDHCLVNGACTAHAPPNVCVARLEQQQQQRTYLINVPSDAVPASPDDRALQLPPPSPATSPAPNSLQVPDGKSGKTSSEGARNQRREETADRPEPDSGPETSVLVSLSTNADSASLWSKNNLAVQQERSGGTDWSVDVQLDSFSPSRNMSPCDSSNREDSGFAGSVLEDAIQKMSSVSGSSTWETVESAVPAAVRARSDEQKSQASSQQNNRVDFKKSDSKPAVKDEAVRKLCDASIINACISIDCLPEIFRQQRGAKEHKTNNRKEGKTAGADSPCKCRRCYCVAPSIPKPIEKQRPNSMLLNIQNGATAGIPSCSSYSTCSQSPAPTLTVNVQIESQFRSAEAISMIKQHLLEALGGRNVFQRP